MSSEEVKKLQSTSSKDTIDQPKCHQIATNVLLTCVNNHIKNVETSLIDKCQDYESCRAQWHDFRDYCQSTDIYQSVYENCLKNTQK